MPDATCKRLLIDIEMANLVRRVHAGIGTTCDSQAQRLVVVAFRHAQNGMQHTFDFPLYGAHVRLFRPSVKIGAVICQVDT